ncbi:hypothetical protein [Paracoccus aminovorans]|uniref:hypothetical protein n=1 Tax=Paracoccus aminovorans TaxID=34004 RepID=UPI001E551320|nr:hypothetical protein [Paracoccus aminovorans]
MAAVYRLHAAQKALLHNVRAMTAAAKGGRRKPDQAEREIGQEQLHQQRCALEDLDIGRQAVRRGRWRDIRAVKISSPKAPPARKVISDSTSVQRGR